MANKTEPLPKMLKKAQDRFNAWIRQRDKNKGCICCGSPVQHCSHYFSQGHYSALRFNETNCNGSCLRCNTFLHGNLILYRAGLVKRHGIWTVQDLENSVVFRKVKKWSRFELEWIIQNYKL
jgi:hypothetical protein